MKKIYFTKDVRRLEIETMENTGVSELELIERASSAVAKRVLSLDIDGRIAVFCGSGKNGADGLAAARILHMSGHDVFAVLVFPEKLCPEAQVKLDEYLSVSGQLAALGEVSLEGVGVIIDAVFGTGLNKAVTGDALAAINMINASSAYTVSVDIPSGINADTGAVMGTAVFADLCITFSFAKLGHILSPGREYSIHTEVVDIGLKVDSDGIDWIEEGDIQRAFPPRASNTHKGDYGKLAVIAGASGMMGAALMSCEAAYRTGSGMVTLAYPLQRPGTLTEPKMHEIITMPLPEKDGCISADAIDMLEKLAQNKECAAVGMGLGRSEDVFSVIRFVALTYNIPLLLDADALFAVAKDPGMLSARPAPTVITPHHMEMARLVGLTCEEVDARPLEVARDFAKRYGVVVLLKGATTFVCSPEGAVSAVTNGSPAMAKAGSGDVLSGIIAALIGMGHSVYDAARIGACLHAAAGSRCAEELGQYSVCATDIIATLGKIISGK